MESNKLMSFAISNVFESLSASPSISLSLSHTHTKEPKNTHMQQYLFTVITLYQKNLRSV